MSKILTTGKGSAGSWKMRGEQLGGEVGTVIPRASYKDCKNSDAIVYIKRMNPALYKNILKSGKPWFWDLVDFYPQPSCTTWSYEQAIEWVSNQLRTYSPTGIIWPTEQMRADLNGVGPVIPHHHWINIHRNEIRQKVRYVGYEGGDYLGEWEGILNQECSRRGWSFRRDLPIDKLDIVVAFRGKDHCGYVQKHWKSAVKLNNAHASGTPFVGMRESGYIENATGLEQWAESREEISNAFDALESYEARLKIHEKFIHAAFSVKQAAEQLRQYVQTYL